VFWVELHFRSTGVLAKHKFFGMINMMLAAGNPVTAILFVLFLVAFAFLWMWGFKALCAKSSGWKSLVEKYPASEIERPEEIFKNVNGDIGSTRFNRAFDVQLVQEGMRVSPNFAPRFPILIPWSKITEVTVSEARVMGHEQNILLKAEWEKPLHFSLPRKTLPAIEAKVAADRFRKTEIGSLPELFKERWQNRNNR
jgi:hypothetical protein